VRDASLEHDRSAFAARARTTFEYQLAGKRTRATELQEKELGNEISLRFSDSRRHHAWLDKHRDRAGDAAERAALRAREDG
jgi:hypothetical protein